VDSIHSQDHQERLPSQHRLWQSGDLNSIRVAHIWVLPKDPLRVQRLHAKLPAQRADFVEQRIERQEQYSKLQDDADAGLLELSDHKHVHSLCGELPPGYFQASNLARLAKVQREVSREQSDQVHH